MLNLRTKVAVFVVLTHLLCMISQVTTEEPLVRFVEGSNNGSDSQGEVQFYEAGFIMWSQVCSGAMDPIDAQLACRELGYTFFSAIAEIETPTPIDSFLKIIIRQFNCISNLQDSPIHNISGCSYSLSISTSISCENTVFLACDNRSSEENTLVVFYGARTMWVINPWVSQLVQCAVNEFHCSGSHFLTGAANNFAIILLLTNKNSNGGCGPITVEQSFGIECKPGAGDVCLQTEKSGDCGGSGAVRYVTDEDRKLGICSLGFGFLEAYVVCTQLGLPKLSALSQAIPELEMYNNSFIQSVDCAGNEGHITQCLIGNITDNCTHVAYLQCSYFGLNEPTDDVMFAIGMGEKSSMPLSVVSSVNGVFIDDCTTNSSVQCSGVYYVNRSLVSVQKLLVVLQTNKTCRGLGPINITALEIDCSAPQVPIQPPVSALSVVPTAQQPTETQEANTSNDPVAIGLGVSLGLLAVVLLLVLISAILTFIGIREKQINQRRNQVMRELETDHSLNYLRSNSVISRPHRSVVAPTQSNMVGNSDDLEIPFGCITLSKEIGSGAYGCIYFGVIACDHQREPAEVAVKVQKKMATASERRCLMLEIEMMKDLGFHRHLVSMVACCTTGSRVALVMEYVPGGNLYDFLKKHRVKPEESEEKEDEMGASEDEESFTSSPEHKKRPQLITADKAIPSGGSLTLTNQLQMARQITLGMEYLASKNIVHRDLATRNILISADSMLKLSDFGLSRDMKESDRYHMHGIEDPLPVRWMAVESIIEREFTVMSDVWAFGVVLWEIMTYAAFPFYHLTNKEVIESVKEGERMTIPDNCPSEVYDIMLKCWKTDPKERPFIRELRALIDTILDTGGYMCLGSVTAQRTHKLIKMTSYQMFKTQNSKTLGTRSITFQHL